MADISAGYLVGKEMGQTNRWQGNVAIIQSPPGALLGVNREKDSARLSLNSIPT